MRGASFTAVCLAAIGITSCSAEKSETGHGPIDRQLVDALVDSYDAGSCLHARLRSAGRKTVGEKVFHERRYEASSECVRDLKQSAKRFGFAEKRAGEWSGEIIGGTLERLEFAAGSDHLPGNLVWEIDVT